MLLQDGEIVRGSRKGPFTVFAPDDAAFAKVPAEALSALLADKAKLAKVLTYHVVSGEVLAKKVVKLKSAKTLEGSSVAIKETDGKVMVGDANVTATDIKCSNGVIHVVDKVLMPQ
ncbi:fasciclin domain-containing protein [bacterium]|nr:fasciclin domain-containing protein [bacterium]MBP9808164.1 fasciclin domain-containing protein [bacterium]